MRTLYRTKWINPDYRPRPKTNRWCEICSRDLKPNQPHRLICVEIDVMEAIYQDDWEIAQKEIESRRECNEPWSIFPIGMDCARKLGLEYSRDHSFKSI